MTTSIEPRASRRKPNKSEEFTGVLLDVTDSDGRLEACFESKVHFSGPGSTKVWTTGLLGGYTPPLTTEEGRVLSDQLQGLIGKHVQVTAHYPGYGPRGCWRVLRSVKAVPDNSDPGRNKATGPAMAGDRA